MRTIFFAYKSIFEIQKLKFCQNGAKSYLGECLVEVTHEQADFDRWVDHLEMRIENHAFGLYDAETANVIIFYASTPENPIVYSDFNFIMAASSGAQRGTFTVTDVSYQVGKFYYFF